ncbi:uncharacterized protein LOC125502245 [Athalia rosae]|uniref:uncharacterized protein LOC125502245 n=1 Tax=Athalia rosae TaxID=37344 RepID=UPI002033E1B6|nr:uncharacterized protein LOC125502245 [Athalia rosae]
MGRVKSMRLFGDATVCTEVWLRTGSLYNVEHRQSRRIGREYPWVGTSGGPLTQFPVVQPRVHRAKVRVPMSPLSRTIIDPPSPLSRTLFLFISLCTSLAPPPPSPPSPPFHAAIFLSFFFSLTREEVVGHMGSLFLESSSRTRTRYRRPTGLARRRRRRRVVRLLLIIILPLPPSFSLSYEYSTRRYEATTSATNSSTNGFRSLVNPLRTSRAQRTPTKNANNLKRKKKKEFSCFCLSSSFYRTNACRNAKNFIVVQRVDVVFSPRYKNRRSVDVKSSSSHLVPRHIYLSAIANDDDDAIATIIGGTNDRYDNHANWTTRTIDSYPREIYLNISTVRRNDCVSSIGQRPLPGSSPLPSILLLYFLFNSCSASVGVTYVTSSLVRA